MEEANGELDPRHKTLVKPHHRSAPIRHRKRRFGEKASEIDMSNLRPKRKTKIHPSPSPPPSSPLSALCLLPPTLLTIVSLLSPSDRQVLAYLILRSLQNPTASSAPKPPASNCATPAFDCGCFDCYTSFWVRWDASPNRDLIHQAIEAFEDHITDLSTNTHKPNKTQKGNCNCKEDCVSATETAEAEVAVAQEENAAKEEVSFRNPPVRRRGGGGGSCSRGGLVRKVWPDVLGLFNSRLWSLWCPNM
ncbi:hypothetical protein ACLOJK_008398 [Asimina triloba]